jgi:uncharacterized protein (TIGR00251 family)
VAGEVIQTGPDGVIIRVYVTPRSSVNKIVGEHNGSIKIALTSPPVDGAANRALVEFLAKVLRVPKAAVTLVSGETSRNKSVAVSGISAAEAKQRLRAE